jgi:hypothetical protein
MIWLAADGTRPPTLQEQAGRQTDIFDQSLGEVYAGYQY